MHTSRAGDLAPMKMNKVSSLEIFVFLLACCPVIAQEKPFQGHFDAMTERALNSNTDVLGERVLLEGEPSFNSVAGFFPPMQRPREVVGVKESPEDFGVTWDGDIEVVRRRRVSFREGNPPSPYGLEGSVRRRLLDGFLPIVETQWEYDGLLHEELVFGYSRNLSADEQPFALVRLRVQNVAESEKKATIRIYYYSTPFGAPDSPLTASIPPKGYHDFYYKIPYQIDLQHLVQTISQAEFDRALEQTRDYWTKLLAQGMQIETPEERINQAYRAWLAYNFLNVDKVNGIFRVHDGSGFYEDVWGYSAAIYCNALSLYGYWDEAEKYLDSLLHFQRADGAIVLKTGMGLPDNGALLFAVGEHYLLSRHLTWFKSLAPQLLGSCEWVARTRAQTKVLDGGQKSLTYGLLPAGQSGGDYASPVQSYYSDVYNWLGLQEIARAFREAGMESEADRWSSEAEDYRKDILASMDKAVVNVGSLKVLPVEPITHRLMNQGGGDYYGLFASMVLETGIFSPADDRSQWITRYMENWGGLLLGLDRFFDGVDHAYTYGYALTQLDQGHIDRFLLTFYSMLAYGMSRDTYSAVEVTHIAQGLNELTLPHTRSNTQQLRMLRMMLVREAGNNLQLASGVPRAWLADGKPLKVGRAPTKFGLVSFTLAPAEAGHGVKGVIEPLGEHEGRYPDYVQISLRAPESWGRLAHVTINGQEQTPAYGEKIQFPGSQLKQQVTILADFR